VDSGFASLIPTVKLERACDMSAKKKRPKRLPSATMAHLNALLDEALEETFPASDSISICLEIGTPQQAIAVQAPHHTHPKNPVRAHGALDGKY
jgi:hypothetical protein